MICIPYFPRYRETQFIIILLLLLYKFIIILSVLVYFGCNHSWTKTQEKYHNNFHIDSIDSETLLELGAHNITNLWILSFKKRPKLWGWTKMFSSKCVLTTGNKWHVGWWYYSGSNSTPHSRFVLTDQLLWEGRGRAAS